MKKLAGIISVILLLALLPLVQLGKDVFYKDTSLSSSKIHKKKVHIIDIPHNINNNDHLIGSWILFLHYPEQTTSINITIDETGAAASSNISLIGDLSSNIDKGGRVVFTNDTIALYGDLNPEGSHIKGMATIQGRKTPLPFSAFKIQGD